MNHSWRVTLYVTPRGLTTGAVAGGGTAISLRFDLREHVLVGKRTMRETFPLEAMSVADFLDRTAAALVGAAWRARGHSRAPTEIPDAKRFARMPRRCGVDEPM
jgi:hypothetical protein